MLANKMANRKDEECALSKAQIVASCDSSGVTFVNEDTPLNLEDGLVEISYINISEDVMVSELGLLDPITNDDDSSRQSSENFEVESDSGDDTDVNPDEEQIAITNDFLSGKISFQDFITRVECSEDSQSSVEDSSDVDDEEMSENKIHDPDYFPQNQKFQPNRLFKLGNKRENNPALSENSPLAVVSNQSSGSYPVSTTKNKKVIRVMRRLPANLLGKYNFYMQLKMANIIVITTRIL